MIGSNTGDITAQGDNFYFVIDGNKSQIYLFSLTGPDGTNFNLEIYRTNTNGAFVAYASGDTYPDETSFGGYDGSIMIVVNAYLGSGSFTLDISLTSGGTGGQTAQQAVEGINNGYLKSETDAVFFSLNANSNNSYKFTLEASEYTNFDMYLYEASLFTSPKKGSNNIQYPDEIIWGGYSGLLFIEVYSGPSDPSLPTNAGSFTLNLSTSPVDPEPSEGIVPYYDEIDYSNVLNTGDKFAWNITEATDSFGLSSVRVGDNITLNMNGTQRDFSFYEDTLFRRIFDFQYNGQDFRLMADEFSYISPYILVLPMDYVINGTDRGIATILGDNYSFDGLLHTPYTVTYSNETYRVKAQDSYFDYIWDRQNGLLLSFSLNIYDPGFGSRTLKIQFISQNDSNADNHVVTDTNTNSSRSEDGTKEKQGFFSSILSSVPFQPISILISMIPLIMIHRKLKR